MLGNQTMENQQKSMLVSGLKGLIPFKSSRALYRRGPLAHVFMETSMFVVKTVDTSAERKECFRLRHLVMCYEFGQNSTQQEGVDKDQFDHWADMLMIQDKKSGKIVGTYRLLCSLRAPAFYSSSEFALGELFAEPGVKLELSRACIKKEFRRGGVIALLWRGIYSYAMQVDADYLFGCCSVGNIGHHKILEMIKLLKQKSSVEFKYSANPLPAYDVSANLLKASFLSSGSPELQIRDLPPLMRAYLNAGAKFLPVPAFDPEFNCYDFLTIMHLKELNQSHTQKFSKQI